MGNFRDGAEAGFEAYKELIQSGDLLGTMSNLKDRLEELEDDEN